MKSKLLSKHKNGISQRLNEEENVYIPSNPVYFDFDQQSVSQNQFKQCHVLPNPYNQEIIDHEKEEKKYHNNNKFFNMFNSYNNNINNKKQETTKDQNFQNFNSYYNSKFIEDNIGPNPYLGLAQS